MKANPTPLSEYVEMQELTGESDADLILRFLSENEMEEEMVDAIVRLLKISINKKDQILNQSRVWIPTIVNNRKINKATEHRCAIPTEDEQILYDLLTSFFLLGMDIPDSVLEEAKLIIPNRERPFVIYNPMLEWLKEKYGIEFFKEEK